MYAYQRLSILYFLCMVATRAAPPTNPGIHKADSIVNTGERIRGSRAASNGGSREGVSPAIVDELRKALLELKNLKQSEPPARPQQAGLGNQKSPQSTSDKLDSLLAFINKNRQQQTEQQPEQQPDSTRVSAKSTVLAVVLDRLSIIKSRIYELVRAYSSASQESSQAGGLAPRSTYSEDGMFTKVKRIGTFGPHGRRELGADGGQSDTTKEDIQRLNRLLEAMQKKKFSNVPGKRVLDKRRYGNMKNRPPGKRVQSTDVGESSGNSVTQVLSVMYELTKTVEMLAKKEVEDQREMKLLTALVEELSALHPSRK